MDLSVHRTILWLLKRLTDLKNMVGEFVHQLKRGFLNYIEDFACTFPKDVNEITFSGRSIGSKNICWSACDIPSCTWTPTSVHCADVPKTVCCSQGFLQKIRADFLHHYGNISKTPSIGVGKWEFLQISRFWLVWPFWAQALRVIHWTTYFIWQNKL